MYQFDPFASRRKPSIFLHVVIGALLFFIVGFLGFEIGLYFSHADTGSGSGEKSLNFSTLYEVKEILEDTFLYDDRFDDQKMTEGAVFGFVASLEDFYTTYFSPEDAAEFRDFLYSELEGIGAELTVNERGFIVVVSPLKGTPAEEAVLLPRDIILEIDGEPAGAELFDAVKRIKGPAGTEVCLTILHENADDPEEICITRAFIDIPAVEWQEVEDGIYHIALRMFDDTIQYELHGILEEIKSHNPKGLILDLRLNGGGFLNGATEVASLFLPAGKQVTRIESREGKGSRSEYTDDMIVAHGLPMVILVDEGSASASEILAATLSYYLDADVVGKTTFGKTTAQEVIDLSNGGLLRVTIAKWLTPDGKTLDNGLVPDYEVENDKDTEADEQLSKALEVLKKKL